LFSDAYLADCDISMLSPKWLFETLNSENFESEMEVCVLVLKWLHFNAKYLNKATLDEIIKSVRVCHLKEYFLRQILLHCPFFEITAEVIDAIVSYQKTGMKSDLLPSEWLIPRKERIRTNSYTGVYLWNAVDLQHESFVALKTYDLLQEEPIFLHYFGVLVMPVIEFKDPIVSVTISTFSCNFPDLLDADKPVNNINCEFLCRFIIGNHIQDQTGLYCDSSITLSCNILGNNTEQDYYKVLEKFSVEFSFKRFE
jgi:hypothetical protein